MAGAADDFNSCDSGSGVSCHSICCLHREYEIRFPYPKIAAIKGRNEKQRKEDVLCQIIMNSLFRQEIL